MGEVKQAVWLHTHSSHGLCTMYTLPKYFPACGATAQCGSRCYHHSQCLFLIFSLSCSLSMSSILFQPKAVTNQSDAAYILFNFIESRGSKHKAEMCRIQGKHSLRGMRARNPGCSSAAPKALGKLEFFLTTVVSSFSLACGKTC